MKAEAYIELGNHLPKDMNKILYRIPMEDKGKRKRKEFSTDCGKCVKGQSEHFLCNEKVKSLTVSSHFWYPNMKEKK